MKIIKKENLISMIKPGANLSGISFNGAAPGGLDLTGMDLSNADIIMSRLDWVVLNDANLNGAKLTWSYAGETKFINATLVDSDMRGMNCRSADMSKATLIRAKMIGSCFFKVFFVGANLSLTKMCWTQCYEAIFVNCNLMGANLYGANLVGTDFNGSDLRSADLTGADLCGASMKNVIINKNTILDWKRKPTFFEPRGK